MLLELLLHQNWLRSCHCNHLNGFGCFGCCLSLSLNGNSYCWLRHHNHWRWCCRRSLNQNHLWWWWRRRRRWKSWLDGDIDLRHDSCSSCCSRLDCHNHHRLGWRRRWRWKRSWGRCDYHLCGSCCSSLSLSLSCYLHWFWMCFDSTVSLNFRLDSCRRLSDNHDNLLFSLDLFHILIFGCCRDSAD